jgi:hypothetical protein
MARGKNNPFRRGRRWAKPIDQSTMGQALRQPGIDPRQWVSIGLVTAGGEGDDIVVFDEDEGQPLVRVLLQPSKIPIFARVGSPATGAAGNGEGEWTPFVEGDEVMVVIPEGDERSGATIIARITNGIDKFPMESVAGQDPTTNTFAFSRRRTPRVEEFNGPIIFRNAQTESFISMDSGGVYTVRTGDASVFQMSPDVIGIQGPSDSDNPPEQVMQIGITSKLFSLTMGDAILNFGAADADPEATNIWKVAAALSLSSNGNNAGEHAFSVENFVNLMVFLMPIINPIVFTTPAQADAALASAITACASSSSGWLLAPLSQSALSGALATQPQKFPGPSTTSLPGVMSTGLQIG